MADDVKSFYDWCIRNDPALLETWHPTKNGNLTPQNIAYSSHKVVWWTGPCGHEWDRPVAYQVKTPGCPFCSGHRVLEGFNDLATTNSDLLEEWHPTKNTLKPTEVTAGSGKKAWWLGKCGHEWEAVISSRKKNGCPFCSGKRILPGYNDLKTLNPELAAQYSPDNPIPVDHISPNSHEIVLWNYPCGHSNYAQVKSRNLGDRGCRYCQGYAVLPGENDFQTLYPDIAKEWDIEKNGKGPDTVRPKSNKKVYWICSFCKQSYEMSPWDRLNHGCPCCGHQTRVSIGEKIIAYYLNEAGLDVIESYHNPALGKMELDIFLSEINLGIEYDGKMYHQNTQRDYEKNKRCKDAGIELVRFREVGCPDLDGTISFIVDPTDYDTIVEGVKHLLDRINERNGLDLAITPNLGEDLNVIIEKKYIAKKEKSLGELYPKVASYIHSDVRINPDAIPCKSNIKLKWKCPDCDYEWLAVPFSVINSYKHGRTGCPRCAGKVLIAGENDAATRDPIAAECWDSARNEDELSEHLIGDTDKRWWFCKKCGKSFERQINVMCRSGSSHMCEPCAKLAASRNRFKKITMEGNNLLEKYPGIAKYWDFEKNGDRPEEYTPNSDKVKWWICSGCGASYESKIIVRTKNNSTECFACSRNRGWEKRRLADLKKSGDNSQE